MLCVYVSGVQTSHFRGCLIGSDMCQPISHLGDDGDDGDVVDGDDDDGGDDNDDDDMCQPISHLGVLLSITITMTT